MVKGFNEREKDVIRNKLMKKGKELFSSYGLKKTSIAELTKASGISQGSFYLFFQSKEELFFDILEREEKNMQDQLLHEVLLPGRIDKLVLKKFLTESIRMVEENQIIRRMYMQDEYEELLRKLPQERIDQHIEKDSDLLAPLIRHWQSEGYLIEKDPNVITGVLRSFFTTSLHKKEIGEDVYEATLDLLAGFIAEGLIRKEGGKDDKS